MSGGLQQWVVYGHPRDYREGYVVRQWEVGPARVTPGQAQTAPTLEAARELVPAGLVRVPRAPDDDPAIVEVWT